MKNSAALLKELKKIRDALNEIVAPQIVVRVVDEDPGAVRDIADGEIAASQRDDVLVIRRLIVDPKTSDSDMKSQAEEDKGNDNQAVIDIGRGF